MNLEVNNLCNTYYPHQRLVEGSWLGLLGGGQLGRMFCMAAQALGFKVLILEPMADSPAAMVANDWLQADYADEGALASLADRCLAISTEFENVPAQSLDFLAKRRFVSPSALCVAIAQDRALEKAFIAKQSVPVATHYHVTSMDDLDQPASNFFPAILKSARLGYDGKGQQVVNTLSQAKIAWKKMGAVPCVLEKKLSLKQEISVIVARDHLGNSVFYPVGENTHFGGILAVTEVPASVDDSLQNQAKQHALAIATALNYVGVLCVEFFVLSDDSLVVNEIAPRPHNSGHYSMDACICGQFEQQARILAGLPLGSTHQHSAALMINILGDLWFKNDEYHEPNWSLVLQHPYAKLHLYGKAEARLARKMGHVNIVAPSIAEARVCALQIARDLGFSAQVVELLTKRVDQ